MGGRGAMNSERPFAPRTVSLLHVDSELGAAVPGPQLHEAARQSTARVVALKGPEWDPGPIARLADGAWLGLFLTDGLLIRRVTVANQASSELLGAGDVIRPWDEDGAYGTLPVTVEWILLEPVTVAVLDGNFALRVARWPSISAGMVQRVASRARRLALMQAVTHMPRIHARMLMTLWLLAERWGTVIRDGVQLKLPLTHRTLATLIGCQRPSATIALRKLGDAGLLVRRSRDCFVLTRKGIDCLREPQCLTLMFESLPS